MKFHPTACRQPLLGLSLLAFACAGHAQSSVTLYGIADAGVRYSSGLNAAYGGDAGSSTAVNSGINTTSRFGFRGSEDLGGGLKATFNLESAVNLDTGAGNATKLFDRAAVVGLQGGWGSVTAGRQTTVLADVVGAVDPLGSRFASFNPNVGIAGLSAHRLAAEFGPAGSTTGAYRLDNSVKYVGRISNFSVRAMHAFGEQASGSSRLSSSGLGAGYQSGAYTAALSYAQFKNAAGLSLKGYLGGASAMLGNNKIALTYGSHEAETSATAKTRNRTLGLGGTVPLGASVDLILAHYQVKRTRTAAVEDGFNRTVAFLEYKLSKRTRAYAELDQTRWKNDYQGVGFKSSASGISAGVVHSF
jgi:predicted porin